MTTDDSATQPAKLSLFERLTREGPHPTVRHASFDPTQPWISHRAIAERVRVDAELHREVATLAKDVEGVPVARTMSQLRMEAMNSIPALQPSARVRTQGEDVATRLDNIRSLLAEISDCQDFVFANPESVNLRSLLETLRHIETEIDCAVQRLVNELGLSAT